MRGPCLSHTMRKSKCEFPLTIGMNSPAISAQRSNKILPESWLHQIGDCGLTCRASGVWDAGTLPAEKWDLRLFGSIERLTAR